MTFGSLEEKLQAAGGAVEMARNSQIGPYVYPAVPAEFTNWRDEQVSWQETSALFDQSHHMTDLQIEGADVIKLLSALGVNTFAELQGRQGEAVRRAATTTATSSATGSSSSWTRTRSVSSGARRPTTGCSTTPRPATTT